MAPDLRGPVTQAGPSLLVYTGLSMDTLIVALALSWFFGLFVHPVFLIGVGVCIVLIGISLVRSLLTGY